jgi:four helix bundle protein
MYSYKDMDVYKVSIDLVVDVYQATAGFPKHEVYGLASQMQRCAVSIPSNIAESSGRQSSKEFVHFLFTANGSLSELETQLEIALRLGYLDNTDNMTSKIKRIRPMMLSLIRSIRAKSDEGKSIL